MGTFFAVLLALVSVFLILLVLVQRGRGGGLTGALGGLGGQSAFGAKAGDMFTRITIGAAAVWILLCLATVKTVGGGNKLKFGGTKASTSSSGAFDVDLKSDKDGATSDIPGKGDDANGSDAGASDSGAKASSESKSSEPGTAPAGKADY